MLIEPLCRHCRAYGIKRPASVPDHIIPLAQGGSDDDDNIQCLCADCHAAKTATETSKGAANHPAWLEPAAAPLTIVCGPPASGKTTYVAAHSRPGDLVIDLDEIIKTIKPGHKPWVDATDKSVIDQAIRERNRLLASLKRWQGRMAWFIVSAPTPAERDWWRDMLGGEVVLLNPGLKECQRRALDRGTPNAVAGAKRWEQASGQPWAIAKPKKRKQEIGLDGWPK